jgi:hypothetical protein
MRLENEAPINDFEKSIETILVLNGYAESEIQFRDNNRYLRIGYWQQLTAKAAKQLESYIDEVVDMYDDDCGLLFFYTLKK